MLINCTCVMQSCSFGYCDFFLLLFISQKYFLFLFFVTFYLFVNIIFFGEVKEQKLQENLKKIVLITFSSKDNLGTFNYKNLLQFLHQNTSKLLKF